MNMHATDVIYTDAVYSYRKQHPDVPDKPCAEGTRAGFVNEINNFHIVPNLIKILGYY